MTIVVRENVLVTGTDTEIIEPMETDKEEDRIFTVSNGENKIEVKAWGKNEGEDWIEKGSIEIEANQNGVLTLGPNVFITKLTGKTLTTGDTSIVDASLTY